MDKPTLSLVLKGAYSRGVKDHAAGILRVSPFYREWISVTGVPGRFDITDLLDQYWAAGYDGKPCPEPEQDALDATTIALPVEQSIPSQA